MVLEVGGMKCGGCSAAVKRILQQQPGVASAAVNLLTETAVVQVADGGPGAAAPHSGHSGGHSVALAAAEVLSAKGFPARLRTGDAGLQGTADMLNERKQDELKRRWGSAGAHHGCLRAVALCL